MNVTRKSKTLYELFEYRKSFLSKNKNQEVI